MNTKTENINNLQKQKQQLLMQKFEELMLDHKEKQLEKQQQIDTQFIEVKRMISNDERKVSKLIEGSQKEFDTKNMNVLQKKHKKLLTCQKLIQCVQKWKLTQYERELYQRACTYSYKQELYKKEINENEWIQEKNQKWLEELCQYKWIQTLFLHEHVCECDFKNNTKLQTLQHQIHKFQCQKLQQDILMLLLDAHKMVLRLELIHEQNLESYPYEKVKNATCTILYQNILEFCRQDHSKKLCFNIIPSISTTTMPHETKYSHEWYVFDQSIINFRYQIKLIELFQKFCQHEWWKLLYRNEWAQNVLLMCNAGGSGRIYVNERERLKDLFVEVQLLKESILNPKHLLRAQNIWDTLQKLCIIINENNLFNINAHYYKMVDTMNDIREQEYLLMQLKMNIYEDEQHELKIIEASIKMIPQYQVQMLLEYHLRNEKAELALKCDDFCLRCKDWIMHYLYDYLDYFNTQI